MVHSKHYAFPLPTFLTTTRPGPYLIDPLHFIHPGLQLFHNLHVGLLHVLPLSLLSLLITALHLEKQRHKEQINFYRLGLGFWAFIIGKMSKKTRNLDKSYKGFSEFRIGNFFIFLQYLNGLFFLRCHFMLMFGCKVIHFSSPFCFQMIKFYALAIQCLLKYTIQKSMHYFPFLLITSCSFYPYSPYLCGMLKFLI